MLKRCSLHSHLVGGCPPGIVTPWASINNTCLIASLLLTVRSPHLPSPASLPSVLGIFCLAAGFGELGLCCLSSLSLGFWASASVMYRYFTIVVSVVLVCFCLLFIFSLPRVSLRVILV